MKGILLLMLCSESIAHPKAMVAQLGAPKVYTL
jgi:hypothetical protein